MRNPKYADELRSLHKRLLKEGKPPPLQKKDPLKALVHAAMSYDMADARAEEAMALIDREFVDLNELRVATELEVQELLGARYPDIEKRVGQITQALNAIFEREHTLSLDRLTTISKRDARQFVRDLPEINPFIDGFVMLIGFEGGAVPLDQQMLGYLREAGAVDEKLSLEEAQRFVEHHLKSDEYYDFFMLVRQAAQETAGDAKKKKVKA